MTAAIAIGAAFLLGVGVPWLTIRLLAPTLEHTSRVTNYRGREVFVGLGIVWLVWAGAALVDGVAAGTLLGDTGSVAQILVLAGLLALVAFAMGMVDDAYGSADSRGFGGHLRALASGRLTTGGLKLIGISAAALVIGLVIGRIAPWGVGRAGLEWVGLSVVAGAAIALTANFINLMDLRPGRALKVYSVLALGAVVCVAVLLPALSREVPTGIAQTSARVVDIAIFVLFLFGPVIAVWNLDLGERGMLGDAGANPMGAVAGMLIVIGLPLWGLFAYAAVMLALNLASERISYSRLIETNALLRRLDLIGRLPAEDPSAREG